MCFLNLQALEDRVTVIEPAALSFVDTETPSEKLVYNVTKPLAQGQGKSLSRSYIDDNLWKILIVS